MAHQGQSNQMPKQEELAASGSGHLIDFDEDDQAEVEEGGMIDMSGRRHMFMKELRCTLYGYGDDQPSYTETVEFLDDLVLEFISDMTQKAMEIGRSGRVQVEDIIFLIRKQPKMYARVRDLLTMVCCFFSILIFKVCYIFW